MAGANRLAGTTSPYLLQHADNPVDWYPWGDEAFARAADEDKPVLLSVGYSSCHWCHVMAHESFEDPDIAAAMNELFVSVKVDREERPDVDAVYMEAVQAMTGRGGWPMTVFLAPDGRPFFAGTYFPKQPAGGMPSFAQVLAAVAEAWKTRRDELLRQADALAEAVASRTTLPSTDHPAVPEAQALDAAYRALRSVHDDVRGGFGNAPKFPQPSMVDLVLRAYSRNRSDETLRMVTTTLDAMASGGIYDHVGGGFARYSVDADWLVPHFEKMLYDQAGLTRAYLHAWLVTGEQRWLQVVEETVGYVLRDLRAPAGGLYSAEDADSEGVEGLFYTWTEDEIDSVLPPELSAAARGWYGVTAGGNFEGRSILHRPVRGDLVRPPEVEEARRLLFEARGRRVRPGLDDKVLTEWNAMFCSVLAEAAAATGRAAWAEAAEGIADFLLAHLRAPTGRWLRSWKDGATGPPAYAADHAWLVDAFTRLSECTGRRRWLEEATAAADALSDLFWDDAEAGVFTTGSDAERLIVRTKDYFDGAVPSANSAAAVALLRLGALTGTPRYGDHGRRLVEAITPVAAEAPTAFTHALGALDMVAGGTTEVVVAGDRPDLLAAVRGRWIPNGVLAWGERTDSPLWAGRDDGFAYVCRHYACGVPAATPDDLLAQLGA